jgi:hypothetical protein
MRTAVSPAADAHVRSHHRYLILISFILRFGRRRLIRGDGHGAAAAQALLTWNSFARVVPI